MCVLWIAMNKVSCVVADKVIGYFKAIAFSVYICFPSDALHNSPMRVMFPTWTDSFKSKLLKQHPNFRILFVPSPPSLFSSKFIFKHKNYLYFFLLNLGLLLFFGVLSYEFYCILVYKSLLVFFPNVFFYFLYSIKS